MKKRISIIPEFRPKKWYQDKLKENKNQHQLVITVFQGCVDKVTANGREIPYSVNDLDIKEGG